MRAISVFSFDAGTSTLGCLAASALRRRVNISAMGSLNIRYPLTAILQRSGKPARGPAADQGVRPTREWVLVLVISPARLNDARDLAVEGELAEAQTAQ